MKFFLFPYKNYILLTIIVVCVALLTILSYRYSVSYSGQILTTASEDIRSNAKIQADYLSLILSDGLKSIKTNLQILSNSRTVQTYDDDTTFLLDAVQRSTNELPDSYLWLDQNGKLLWLSGMDENTFNKQKGLDLSYAPFFTIPRDKHSAYYSDAIVEPE